MRKPSTRLLLIWLGSVIAVAQVSALAKTQSKAEGAGAIPTVDVCEMAKHPRRYFNQTVRVEARWQIGFEFSFLEDDRCPMGDTIAVGFIDSQSQREEFKQSREKIMSHEYGGRALMRVVGVLRNPGKYYGYFRYRFEILRIEEFGHVIVPYEGTLDAGKTYRARVRGDKNFGLAPVPDIKMPLQYAIFIEWTNLSEFPELETLRNDSSRQQQLVFSVMSSDIKQMTADRWNRTIECKIIRLE